MGQAAPALQKSAVTVDPGDFKFDPSKVKSNIRCEIQKDRTMKCDSVEPIVLRGDAPSSIVITTPRDDQGKRLFQIRSISANAGQTYNQGCLNHDHLVDGKYDEAQILLHMDTWLWPSYNRPWGMGTEFEATRRLRPGIIPPPGTADRDKAHLVTPQNCPKADNKSRQLTLPVETAAPYVTVVVQEDVAAGQPAVAHTYNVGMRQRPWWIDTGVMLAWMPNAPKSTVRTQVVQGTSQVQVVEHKTESEREFLGGVLITAYPNNYPNFGMSLGIGTGEESKPSWLVGVSLRLLSDDKVSAATMTVGRAWRPTKVYDVNVGDVVDPSDARLTGEIKYRSTFYIGLQLGFAIKGL